MLTEKGNRICLKVKEGVCSYGKEILKRKYRLILAVIVSLVLFGLSNYYIFDGFNRRFFIYTALSFLTGALLVCPRLQSWYLALPMVVLYLVFVPTKMFERIEVPAHDMTGMRPGVTLANVMLILLIYAVLLLLFQRIHIAFAVGGTLLLILTVINYFCVVFRGDALGFYDLTAAKTALTILKSYHFQISAELWYTILYFFFFIVLGAWCAIPLKGKKYHVTVTILALAFCLFFHYFWKESEYLEAHSLRGDFYSSWETLDGFLVGFVVGIESVSMDYPWGYSEGELSRIGEEATDAYTEAGTPDCQPNIIFIMNEAWSDLRVLGNLETSSPFMPFVDSIAEIGGIRGNTHVEILGGLTPNSEYEALTGNCLAFLSTAAIPYNMQINHDMYSMARVLKEQGYQTMAMHPSGADSWERDAVYSYLGFDEFIDIKKFQEEPIYIGYYPSDEYNYDEIIWQFEHRDQEKPLFLFDVTIQNHADYYGQVDADITIEGIGDTPMEEAGDLLQAETYLSLMKVTDDALRYLVSYFETVEEPVILCMFGDHQPKLNDIFYSDIFEGSDLSDEEQTARQYITPYVMWANYDVDFPEYGDISANYLGAALMECAGVELSPYFKFVLEMQRQYPIISFRTIQGIEDDDAIRKYQILQYANLMDKRNAFHQVFSVSP